MTFVETFLDALTTVWTPEALGVALAAGLVVGVLALARVAELPTYASDASPTEIAVALAVTSIIAGAVFYSGQAIVDSREDVPARLLSRFGVWCVYSLGMAGGTWLSLTRALVVRRSRIRHTAEVEVDRRTNGQG